MLDREVFYTLLEVRVLTEHYRQTYDRIRPLGLQGTGVGDHPAHEPCPRAGRVDIASVKITWRMSGGVRKGKAKVNQSGNVGGNGAVIGLILYLWVVATTGLEPVT